MRRDWQNYYNTTKKKSI